MHGLLDPLNLWGQIDLNDLRSLAEQAAQANGATVGGGHYIQSPLGMVFVPEAGPVPFSGARVLLLASQTIATGIGAGQALGPWAVPSAGEPKTTWDTGGWWDSASPSQLTVPADGTYLCGCGGNWNATTLDTWQGALLLLVNGETVGASVNVAVGMVAVPLALVAGDVLTAFVYQRSGSSQVVLPGDPTCLWAVALAPLAQAAGGSGGGGTTSGLTGTIQAVGPTGLTRAVAVTDGVVQSDTPGAQSSIGSYLFSEKYRTE